MLTVAALYHFAALPDAAARRAGLLALAEGEGLCGTILLAAEGVNGTIAGPRAGVLAVIDHLRGWPGFAALGWKESQAEAPPFRHMKVRVKREIVTMGQPGVDPARLTGQLVPPAEWNALIAAPDVVVIDTRNRYEVAIGSFAGAIDPGTESFREFPAWWEANRAHLSGRRIAMFCTGGIRCEKATNWLIQQGETRVHHLQGGILGYLEQVAPAESLWQGECFVFDARVAVGYGLAPGEASLCHACRRPVTEADRADPAHEEGVACRHCAAETSAEDKARYRERQRQLKLAAANGRSHMAGM